MGSREFDAIVFGASGFTGQFVVEEMARSMEMDSLYKRDNLKWAIAGRSREKLVQVLENCATNTKLDWCKRVPIIEADVEDYKSILEMCQRSRLVLSVVGPYRFFGEPVVRACVEAATNYVDISGEPQFLEGMQLKYHEEAKRKNIHIVSAAGWDSIPADLGTSWTKRQLQEGELSGVEIFVTNSQEEAVSGPALNFGTWHSAIYGFANMSELGPLRRKLYQEVLPLPVGKPKFPLAKRRLLSYVDEIKGYCLPFMGSDRTVVRRSEIFKYNQRKERPIGCETYFRVETVKSGILIILAASVFALFAKTSFGRYLLKKFPGFFSFGYCSKEGVPRETLQKRSFKHLIVGYGWDEKLADPDMQHAEEPRRKIITSVSGPDPGYIGTAILLVHAGMTILFDSAKLGGPGVITPGAAFQDTYLVDRLSKRDIKFEVVERF